MDAHTLFNRQWFGKIDTDGIPIAIIVNGEVYARCPRCKIHKHPSETLLVSSMPKRVCKKCQSKACCDRHYAREGKVKQRPKIIWMQCPKCNQQVKKTQWNRNRKCCNQCGQVERQSLRKKPKCKLCGKETNGKKYQYCSVKCMTDAKRKRHIVQCVHCHKYMEVQESRYKARAYFICSEECRKSDNAKRKAEKAEKRMADRARKETEKKQRQEKTRDPWMQKATAARYSSFGSKECLWVSKCRTAIATMKKRISTVCKKDDTGVTWQYWIPLCRNTLIARTQRRERGSWERKCATVANNHKRKAREVNAIN